MSKRELNDLEIPAFLHIVTGILLEPRLHTTAPKHPDLVLECLDINARRVRLEHPDKRHRLAADSWETLDQQAIDFAAKLPPDIYKKARAVLRKRRQRYAAGTLAPGDRNAGTFLTKTTP